MTITTRPAIVETRTRIGDWEGDTVTGKGRKGVLLTLVERKTLYTVIARLDGKHAELVGTGGDRGLTGAPRPSVHHHVR